MADATITMPIDQFNALQSGPRATNLVLLSSLNLTKNAILTINEVNALGVATGVYGYGTIKAIAAGQFYSLPVGYNQYYLNPLTMSPWVNYSSLSTIVGFSSFTYKEIIYQVTGNTVFFSVALSGTSNSTALTFTLPFNMVTGVTSIIISHWGINNGTALSAPCISYMDAGTKKFFCYPSSAFGLWTASGTKTVFFSGFYKFR